MFELFPPSAFAEEPGAALKAVKALDGFDWRSRRAPSRPSHGEPLCRKHRILEVPKWHRGPQKPEARRLAEARGDS